MYNYGYGTTTYLLHCNKEQHKHFLTDIDRFLQSFIHFETIKVETNLCHVIPRNETIWCSIKCVIIPLIMVCAWHRSDQWARSALRNVSWRWKYVSAHPTPLLPSMSSVLLSIIKIKHSQQVMFVILVNNIINVRISVDKPLFQ